jgi:hypothetical protein
MNRREFVALVAGSFFADCLPAFGQAKPNAFASLLAQIAANSEQVEDSWQYRDATVRRGVGHGKPSKRKLSKSAVDLIVACEIASPRVYERKYRRPIWPKGQSGVTVGVGYDLRFANRNYIDRDWPMLSAHDRDLLASVAALSGTRARAALPAVHSVVIPWNAAETQFMAFLPYPTAETERVFPNCDQLPDDAFGALVSLVYNRGSRIARKSKSRREMFEIQQLMGQRKFADIPGRIRSMKRLWTTRDSRGLVLRREAEAVLFERSLPVV